MGERRKVRDSRPVYLRIAEDLRRAYEPGEQLLSVPKLAEQWGVARETVRSALEVLRHEGLVVSWQGRGTFYRTGREVDAANEAPMMRSLREILSRLDDFEHRLESLERATSPAEAGMARQAGPDL